MQEHLGKRTKSLLNNLNATQKNEEVQCVYMDNKTYEFFAKHLDGTLIKMTEKELITWLYLTRDKKR